MPCDGAVAAVPVNRRIDVLADLFIEHGPPERIGSDNAPEFVTGWWREHYNRSRPHSRLGYRPSAPETARVLAWPLGSAALRLPPKLASQARIN